MAELLKNLFSADFVESLSQDFQHYCASFDANLFCDEILTEEWEQLELKDRMHKIADCMHICLPDGYPQAIEVLLKTANHYSGLVHMCFPDYVERFGMHDFETSLNALEHLTQKSSSEFAIRPFIIHYPKQGLEKLSQWAKSENEHIRRLASEGCRPRLPWAMALPEFKKDPAPILSILLDLIDDESLYVRRSVANNLNDISKDNPEVLIEIAEKYLGRSANIDWVIKHASRGLLKQGEKQVLKLFGFSKANHITVSKFVVDNQVAVGNQFNFSFQLSSRKKKLGKLRIEFIIEFMKANGKTSGKIFKIGEGDYQEKTRSIMKHFSFKPISTRKYYLGRHALIIVINGERFETRQFSLV